MVRKRKLNTRKFKKTLEAEKARLGGDAARDTAERGQVAAIGENFRDILAEVNTALEKIEDGTYGICNRCGKNIPKSRLEFLPYATTCAKCRKALSG